MSTLPLLLHVTYSFEAGGAEMRTATLMNALAGEFRHRIIAIDGQYGCAARLHPDVDWAPVAAPGRRKPWSAAAGLRQLLRELRPALLLTYNWGAIDALLALLPDRICPAVHVEDGFGPDEARGLKARRLWTRRVVLPRVTRRVVVPSATLYRIAEAHYGLPEGHLLRVPNGVDTVRFQPGGAPELRNALGIPGDSFVVGTVARLRPEKDLPYLVHRFADAGLPEARLLIAGSGSSEMEIREAARSRGVLDRVVFAGELRDPAPCYAAMDLFAMSSTTEQMPMGLLEAMSSGLPALCTDVGDIPDMLPPGQRQFAVPHSRPEAYTAELRRLAADAGLRAELARENRERAEAEFSLNRMIERWREVYIEALHMPSMPQEQGEDIP